MAKAGRAGNEPNGMAPGSITSERLTLRPLREDDAPAMVDLFAGDWDAVRHTGRMPWPVKEKPVRAWLRLHMGAGTYSYALLGETGAVVGMAGYGGEGRQAELGYGIGRRYWNRGYASEAVRTLVGQAGRSQFDLLHAYAFPENPASARVLEKTGFVDLGIIERDYPARGGLRRVRHFRMNLREDQD